MISPTRQISGFLKRCAGTMLVLRVLAPSTHKVARCAIKVRRFRPAQHSGSKERYPDPYVAPGLITAVIAYLAYRKRDKYNETY